MTGPRLRGMTLTVTERCNLRCGYCYVPVDRGRTMSDEIAAAAVDLFARHAAGDGEVSLSFFGGEPFLSTELMGRSIERTRRAMGSGRRVRVATPTNGTLLEGERLDFCREHGIEVTISLDGTEPSGERPFAGGGDSIERLLPLLPGILALGPAARVTARMTVTPSNVGRLAENVAALDRIGFRRIVFLPAFELEWGDEAVEAWGREHRRIGTWLVGLHGAGRRPPDLPTWRGVESRLIFGKPRRACGAGVRLVAVAPDGGIHPCYRFVFAADNESWRLGHVFAGLTNREALAVFATLDPTFAKPQDGDCATCPACDGCTFFCPALGHWILRDPLAIPAVACRLSRVQVEAIRPYAAGGSRAATRPARRRIRLAAAAAVATAVTGAAAASCDSAGPTPVDAADLVADAPADAGGDADADAGEEIGPGVCPVGADADAGEEIGPGVCPVGADADADAADDVPGPGTCPVPGLC